MKRSRAPSASAASCPEGGAAASRAAAERRARRSDAPARAEAGRCPARVLVPCTAMIHHVVAWLCKTLCTPQAGLGLQSNGTISPAYPLHHLWG